MCGYCGDANCITSPCPVLVRDMTKQGLYPVTFIPIKPKRQPSEEDEKLHRTMGAHR